jgi:protein CpxP
MSVRIQRLPLAAVALLAAMGLVEPSFAQQSGAAGGGGNAAAPAQTGNAGPAQAGAAAGNETAGQTAAASRARTPESWAEHQLSRLHRQLHITGGQEADWNKFREVTLAGARDLAQLYRQRADTFEKMNAVENLKDYQRILQKQAEDLGQKIAAFEALWNTLSPEQKETADRIFRYQEQRREARHLAAMRHRRSAGGGATENGGMSQQ